MLRSGFRNHELILENYFFIGSIDHPSGLKGNVKRAPEGSREKDAVSARLSKTESYRKGRTTSLTARRKILNSLKHRTPREPRLLPDRPHQIAQGSLKCGAFDVRRLETWVIAPGKGNYQMRAEVPEVS